ncbi:hypothetical protein GLYMA_16G116500v4 [Glycine max]|nr:hypothetical protein GLYMA_16G116500v4 [Glycine max]
MGDEASEEHQRSLAAPFIFFVVLTFQFASNWIDHSRSCMLLLQSGSNEEKETKLRVEIKELLKEASSLSQSRNSLS